jgi:hypothetical protein
VLGPVKDGFVLGVAVKSLKYWLEDSICLPYIMFSAAPAKITLVSSKEAEYTPDLVSPIRDIVGYDPDALSILRR